MKKMNNKKGFTLMELLIVVAIIAILVAVSIPVFTSQLEKARETTDVANMRAAKAEAVTQYLTDGNAGTYYYDAVNGTLKSAKTGITAYGKGTSANGNVTEQGYTNADYTSSIIKVEVAADGTVTISWETAA